MTTIETSTDSVEDIIASMLVENTGRHFLDSGGAYGRNWERNQGLVEASGLTPRELFEAASPGIWDTYGYPMVHIYHYLKDRLDEVSEPLNTLFDEFVDGGKTGWERDRWSNAYGTAEQFVEEELGVKHYGGGYTYNHENLLSQDFQWVDFEVEDPLVIGEQIVDEGHYIGISIHGGCDARGGFTDYKWFRVYDDECPAVIYQVSDANVSFECPHCECSVMFDVSGGEMQWGWVTPHYVEPQEETLIDVEDVDRSYELDHRDSDEVFDHDLDIGLRYPEYKREVPSTDDVTVTPPYPS